MTFHWDEPIPGGKPIQIDAIYQETDLGQDLLVGASETAQPIWVQFKRPWRERLFSWPWRPWQKYHAKPQKMIVTDAQVVKGPGGNEIQFTLEQL